MRGTAPIPADNGYYFRMKKLTLQLLEKYYQLGETRAGTRMAKETGISIQICKLFLEQPTFREGLDLLKKFYVWIWNDRTGRPTNDY